MTSFVRGTTHRRRAHAGEDWHQGREESRNNIITAAKVESLSTGGTPEGGSLMQVKTGIKAGSFSINTNLGALNAH